MSLNETGVIKTVLNDTDADQPVFDNPHGSEWIVSIDCRGDVSIIKHPNIHSGFFEGGMNAEYIGLPFEETGLQPGVYKWICDFEETHDWETGNVDGCEFSVRETTCLWVEGQVDKMMLVPIEPTDAMLEVLDGYSFSTGVKSSLRAGVWKAMCKVSKEAKP